jgi:hypothetical protein
MRLDPEKAFGYCDGGDDSPEPGLGGRKKEGRADAYASSPRSGMVMGDLVEPLVVADVGGLEGPADAAGGLEGPAGVAGGLEGPADVVGNFQAANACFSAARASSRDCFHFWKPK